ncbi:toxin-antitoxin system YwqK family antitoxin [Parachlamydia acanthamoebae]|nr:hypothetical protein [Parachlamydia acanthamoebae]EFB40302.1 hypothetical protein pah_c209o026 [Parachlamydia acanthamoebae str. Hall's coccus]
MAYEYYGNGAIKKQALFIQDKKEGDEKSFFPSGQKSAIYPYKNGELHGTCREWNEDGTLIFEGEYVHGEKHGKFNKYDDLGLPKVLQTFDHGKLINKKKDTHVLSAKE